MDEAIETAYSHDFNYDVIKGLFVWNQWTKDWLLMNRNNINENKILVSGSVRTRIKNNISIKDRIETVGILSRFEFINIFDDRHNFKLLIKHYTQGGFWKNFKNKRWKYDLDYFLVCLSVIEMALKTGLKVSIRPHPNENIESYKYIQEFVKSELNGYLEVNTSPDYLNWLNNIDVLTGANSTAFAEAYLARLPIICLDGLVNASYLDDSDEWHQAHKEGAYYPKDSEELLGLLTRNNLLRKESNTYEEYLFQYYDLNNGDAIDRRVSSIISHEDSFHNSKSVLRPIWLRITSYWLDLSTIMQSAIKYLVKRNKSNYFLIRLYHYNQFLHKPSKYMINYIRRNK